jgi:hypothetical protein
MVTSDGSHWRRWSWRARVAAVGSNTVRRGGHPRSRRPLLTSLPKASIIHAAMLWMVRKAVVETSAAASASTMTEPSSRETPVPPCSGRTYSAPKPREAALRSAASGNVCSSAARRGRGRALSSWWWPRHGRRNVAAHRPIWRRAAQTRRRQSPWRAGSTAPCPRSGRSWGPGCPRQLTSSPATRPPAGAGAAGAPAKIAS